MKKKEIRQQIGDWFEDTLKLLKIGGHSVYVFLPEDEEWEAPSVNGVSVKLDYPYQRIHLFLSKDIIENYEEYKESLKANLLHEGIHILLWRYTHLAESRYVNQKQLHDEEERVVDHLAHVIELIQDK